MGIGNTTASAAVIAALSGRSASEVTGRGTGVDDQGYARKIAIVDAAVARIASSADAVAVLAEVGGLEIAALSGFIVGAASHRVPVIVDGVIALAGLMAAVADCPEALPYVIAGHRSTEPGATVALAHLGLEPILDLGLRLGEGTGACLALHIVESAARVLAEMATFETAGLRPVL
jgi:nicotinate-nucleotide--dimethylbenzimidazole phosphoribosyltransferase